MSSLKIINRIEIALTSSVNLYGDIKCTSFALRIDDEIIAVDGLSPSPSAKYAHNNITDGGGYWYFQALLLQQVL